MVVAVPAAVIVVLMPVVRRLRQPASQGTSAAVAECV